MTATEPAGVDRGLQTPHPPSPRGRGGDHPEGWALGSIAGIPVILARSWFIIAAVITFTFEPVVAGTDPTLPRVAAFALASSYAVLLGVSVLVHELAHALTARSFGLPASRIVLTLWGGHTQFEQEVPTPGRSFAVAVAGPLANGALALAAWGSWTHLGGSALVELILRALMVTNAFVALSNVLPGLPLDGGRLLEAVVWRLGGDRDLGTLVAGWVGRLVAVGVPVSILGWYLLHQARPPVVTIVWVGALGALMWAGAGAALSGARIRRRAPAATVASLARPAVGVPAGASLDQALEAASAVPGGAWVVLLDAGEPVAVLDPDAVAAVPVDRRRDVLAASASRSLPDGAVVPDHLVGQDLLRALSAVPSAEWVVRSASGSVTGLLLVREVVAVVMGQRAAARA